MMKKMLLAGLVAVMTLGSVSEARANEAVEKIVLYIPNRLLDVMDIFSVNLGFGPTARLELMGTRAVAGGVSVGAAAMLYKDCNRQYGWGLQNGWSWQFPGIIQEDTERLKGSRIVKDYWEDYFGVPDPSRDVYEYFRGPRDFWQIGGGGGLLVTADVYIHPVEWLDLALGFVFMDIKDDDLSFESFQ